MEVLLNYIKNKEKNSNNNECVLPFPENNKTEFQIKTPIKIGNDDNINVKNFELNFKIFIKNENVINKLKNIMKLEKCYKGYKIKVKCLFVDFFEFHH